MVSKVCAVGLIIVVSLIIGLAFFNLLIGCGETVYYDNGTWETLDCLFIQYEQAKGEW